MSDFKNKEVVFFQCNGAPGFDDYEGQECRIVGSLKDYPIRRSDGTAGVMNGHAIRFTFNSRECIVRVENLKRLTPARGDMDRLVTWDYVIKETGSDPRKEVK